MKTAILASLFATLVTVSATPVAAKNATLSPHKVAKPNPDFSIDVAAPTISPYLFNLLASDGTYLGQDYGSLGAYLSSTPSAYRYILDGTTLKSTSSDILLWNKGNYGDGGCFLGQPDIGIPAMTCKVEGKYPSFRLSCPEEKGGSFGNADGYLYYGTKSELIANGATAIKFTLVPACN